MSDTGGSSFRPVQLRPPPVAKTTDEKLRDASKMYEKLFMSEMVKAMRSTIHDDGIIKTNAAEKMFRDELDKEYVDSWSDKGGVGFADVIYHNMIDKYGVQMGLKTPEAKPVGPLKLDAKSNYEGFTHQVKESPDQVDIRFDRANAKGVADLKAPWSGEITAKKELGEGNQMLELKHDNGFKSRLVFRGSSERLILGQSVQSGENIGLLSPEAKSFFWTLAPEKKPATE